MSWLSRLFSPPEAGYDLLADPALARLSARALADLPLWPAPDEGDSCPQRAQRVLQQRTPSPTRLLASGLGLRRRLMMNAE